MPCYIVFRAVARMVFNAVLFVFVVVPVVWCNILWHK